MKGFAAHSYLREAEPTISILQRRKRGTNKGCLTPEALPLPRLQLPFAGAHREGHPSRPGPSWEGQ